MSTSYQQRLKDLQERYNELEGHLPDTKEKETISILHAMIQENMRARRQGSSTNKEFDAISTVKVFLTFIIIWRGNQKQPARSSGGPAAP